MTITLPIMPTAFVCVDQVNNPKMSNTTPDIKDMEYVSIIMLPDRGQFVKAITTFDTKENRWITSFWWLWLSVNGFTHKWIAGDPVKTGDTAWLRKDGSMDTTSGTVKAHAHAVEYFIKCADAHKVPAATYMGKSIPNLFGPSRYDADVNLKPTKTPDPVQEILDMIQGRGKSKMQELFPTQEDIDAMHSMNPNYALGA